VLASIWFCVMRQPRPEDSTTRHQDLIAVLCGGDRMLAAEAVRQHIAVGMERSLEVLQPYFKLRKATGRTFYRSNRKLKQRPLDMAPLPQC
jgi:DNA-binding GntR family transcriptional regulator